MLSGELCACAVPLAVLSNVAGRTRCQRSLVSLFAEGCGIFLPFSLHRQVGREHNLSAKRQTYPHAGAGEPPVRAVLPVDVIGEYVFQNNKSSDNSFNRKIECLQIINNG